jgi:hypothetical protein
MGYFYEIRGKLNGGLAVINSLISSGYNMLAEKFIINPFGDEADIDENFYSFDVSKSMKTFFIIIMIIYIIGTIFGLILIIPYDIEKHRNAIFSRKNSSNENEEQNENINIENEFKEGDDNKILLDENDNKEEKENENNKSGSQKKNQN